MHSLFMTKRPRKFEDKIWVINDKMRKMHQCIFFILVVALNSLINIKAEESSTQFERSGFLDFNWYPILTDIDYDSTMTLNIAATLTPELSYFSLTNFVNQADRSELSETAGYYSEHSLRHRFSATSPFDWTFQSNFRSGQNNDRHRLGIRWRLNDFTPFQEFFKEFNLKYAINLHAVQFDDDDNNVWQLEHSFYKTFPSISEKLYLAGFIDHTFNESLPAIIPNNPIVMEAQLGYEIVNDLYLVTEYRINQYRREDVNNIAIGVQYKYAW